MKKNLNIAIGKIGKSILFDSKKFGAIGGDNEPQAYYRMLFDKHPDWTFYLIGKSDYSLINYRLRDQINKNNNVIDVWEGFPDFKGTSKRLRAQEWMYQKIEELPKMDCAILFAGPDGTANIEGKVDLATDPGNIARPLEALINYTGPIYEFLNITKTPYSVIVTDPRYFPPRGNDIFVPAHKALSQYNEEVIHKCYLDYNDVSDRKKFPVKVTYDAVETIFLLDKEKGVDDTPVSLSSFFEDEEAIDKTVKFMVVLNEGRPSRYDMLNEYVLKEIDDVDIYGKWSDERTLNDPRFKGPKKFLELQEMLSKVKYTFIIPIKKGWVTAKFWEMAHYGIIPFMHPTYDEQNNLKCPEFLRVKSAKDLHKRIEYLEQNPDKYDIIKKQLDDMLKEEYYNGDYLDNITMNTIKEMINE